MADVVHSGSCGPDTVVIVPPEKMVCDYPFPQEPLCGNRVDMVVGLACHVARVKDLRKNVQSQRMIVQVVLYRDRVAWTKGSDVGRTDTSSSVGQQRCLAGEFLEVMTISISGHASHRASNYSTCNATFRHQFGKKGKMW